MKETNQTNETTPEESHYVLLELRDALQNAVNDGDMQRAGELKAQIVPHLEALKQRLDSPDEAPASLDEAKEIMGDDFLGPEAVRETFCIGAEIEDIPDIPFSKADIKRAKELGQFLILRKSKSPKGEPLTIEKMATLATWGGNNNIEVGGAFDLHALSNAPEPGWALVTKDFVESSTNKGYLEQIDALVRYITLPISPVFDRKGVPSIYKRALEEFEAVNEDINENYDTYSDSKILKKVSDLEITKLMMPSVSEAVYDMLVYCQSKHEPHMFGIADGDSVATRTIGSMGDDIIGVSLGTNAIDISYIPLEKRSHTTGVLFARKV